MGFASVLGGVVALTILPVAGEIAADVAELYAGETNEESPAVAGCSR